MKKLLLLFAICALLSCDSGNVPNASGTGSYWPYTGGDTYTLVSPDSPPGWDIAYTVRGDTMIENMLWNRHIHKADFVFTLENSPEPIGPTPIYSRESEDTLFLMMWGDKIVFDKRDITTPTYEGFVSATRTNILSNFKVGAGTFEQAFVYDVPDASNIQMFIFAPNVGIVRLDGKVGTWDLQSASIAGRSYP